MQNPLSERLKDTFRAQLLSWYHIHGRTLPWRQTSDPYHILVSEIFLHQTQVRTVLPVYEQFLQKFPSLETLAKADLPAVKAITDPLGYKVRGKWLLSIAKIVMEKHNGQLPNTLDELMALEGIGRYTAGAILSFAFKKRAPIVDTNVERIIRRVFDLEEAPENASTEKQLWRIAEELLPSEDRPQDIYDFNQAIMDLGAMICQTKPSCPVCPLRKLCARGRKFPRQTILAEFTEL